MTIRTVLPTVALATLLPSPMAAQRYKIPDSLAYLGFPDDPMEYAARFAAREPSYFNLLAFYDAGGCRSDGKWTTALLDALEEYAETDMFVRQELAQEYGFRLKHADRCPADLPGLEAWITRTLRQRYEAGIFYLEYAEQGVPHAGVALMGALWESTTPEAHALILEIALDPRIHFAIERDLAVRLARKVGVLRDPGPYKR